ncbi:hypothetical protein B7P43_G03720 [Cryptotermes secundus]|uniref:Reverse transcriptase domain-containing protein n=1 Tax=Cryptotermes secundus TaxID=105785 RepID=A0A2J7R400_9NEOP|nr:hypothetical protein B7P43_G03720 [Cryptotermes secundus]
MGPCDFWLFPRLKTPLKSFVNDRLSYITLKGRWCDIIVMNVDAPTEDKKKPEHVFDNFPKHQMKILLRDFTAKVGREDIFKQTIGNESLHEISNDNGDRVVNFATSKNLTVKSTMFPHRNFHKFTWTSPDGKSIWHKGKLPNQWKESIIVPVHKKGDKTDRSNVVF